MFTIHNKISYQNINVRPHKLTYRWTALCVLLAFGLVSCKTVTPPQIAPPTAQEPVLLQIGENTYSPDDFFDAFTRNRFSQDSAKAVSVGAFFEVYTTNRLKLAAARQAGRDTTSDFLEEIASYRDQLATPYLTDKELIDELANEAYKRLEVEVHASHILTAVPEDASPDDTLAAYRAAVAMRGRLLEGEDFGEMARKFSADSSARTNRGDLGFFTAFQMVYPFETAAYNTPIGQISEPVRSSFGYHLIKVHARRPGRGKLRVQHILIREQKNTSATTTNASAEQRIQDAYSRLLAGESWDKMVQIYSDDFQSRTKAGLLPPFGTGELMPSLEEAAFALTEPGAISKPVRSTYGWHILRLVEKRPLEAYTIMQPYLQQKVTTDTRGKRIQQAFINQLKQQYTIQENSDAWSKVAELADSSLLMGTWKIPADKPAIVENPVLFTIEKEASTSVAFLEHVQKYQTPLPAGAAYQTVMKRHYNDFLGKRLLAYEKANLENKYPDFKNLLTDMRESVLLSQLMEQEVYQRSLNDSLGQRRIYEQNLAQYSYPERARALVLDAKDTTTLHEAFHLLEKEPYPLQLKGEELLYEESQTKPNEQQVNTLYILAATLKKNADFVVEINGYRTAGEADTVSAARINHVVRYLNQQGISIGRIMEKDNGSFKPVEEPARNRRVSFLFFSRNKKDIEKSFNSKQPNTLKLIEGFFAKDHPLMKDALWEEGVQEMVQENGRALGIEILKIAPPRPKTFSEARGTVINAYQKILEKQWIESLKSQFPVKVNQEELEKLIR
ncbi:peptidylprolyl isomerase [Arundinibacter roseus]|uniref:Peptidylprolyl isomerase n=1 Tax=Arundinibacter roseus TaxID=2070510 RepID=A0A4R4K3P4_9BACT|nr:peptidylprolyl isomerase [Arundinibacter roseus]TDB61843.1 peptidylprolyl isomerase [Arundinibacter roseus]